MKISSAHGMLDIRGFYDAIQWGLLLTAALRLGYPPAVLFLEMAQCAAPRTLEQFGAVCEPFLVQHSII